MSDFTIALIGVGISIVFCEGYVYLHRRWVKGQGQHASTLIAQQVERDCRQASGKAPTLSGPASKGIQSVARRHQVIEMAERRKQAGR